MFILTETGELINLNNITAITYRKQSIEEYAPGIGKVMTQTKDSEYEIVAETDHKEYVIQTEKDLPDVVVTLDLITKNLTDDGELIQYTPDGFT